MMRRKLFQSRLATEERGFSWLELAIIVPVAIIIALIMTETVWFFVAQEDLDTLTPGIQVVDVEAVISGATVIGRTFGAFAP